MNTEKPNLPVVFGSNAGQQCRDSRQLHLSDSTTGNSISSRGSLANKTAVGRRRKEVTTADAGENPACAASFKRMGGRAAYCSGLENRQTLKSLVGSNPTLSASFNAPDLPQGNSVRLIIGELVSNPTGAFPFCGSARIDVHPGASQPVKPGNDEAGLSAEMFRDKPHPLPKPSREAAARPKCAGNETGYKPHGGSSLAEVAESFAGSDGLQPVTLSKNQRQTGEYPGAAAKPDSSPAKISPKCCLPFIITNYCAHRWGKTTPNGKQVCKRCGTVKGFKTTNHCAA